MIVTVEDMRNVRPIALNINSNARIEPYIEEAEHLFVMREIGVELYKLVEATPADHTELLDGGYYDNNKKHFAGLKTAISYLAYSRFVRQHSIHVTPTGIVQKTGEYSNPVATSTISAVYNEAEKVGLEYLRQCVDYIRHTTIGCGTSKISNNGFKIKAIG